MRREPGSEIIVKDTHRALWYEDGKLTRVLEAGRYEIPRHPFFGRGTQVEVELVDMREQELTIRGQEILTADKVAIRVSVLVQYRVTDPTAAMHTVSSYEDRLYSDVQLAARRSLASMTLDEILTNRNRLSEEILADVKETAAGYGVAIRRADVKDLLFPGDLQQIMNRVLAAERNSEATLVEARTRAEMEQIEALSRAETIQREAAAEVEAQRLQREAELEAARSKAEAETILQQERARSAALMDQHPSLLRLHELETLQRLAANANAKLYLNVDRPGLGERVQPE